MSDLFTPRPLDVAPSKDLGALFAKARSLASEEMDLPEGDKRGRAVVFVTPQRHLSIQPALAPGFIDCPHEELVEAMLPPEPKRKIAAIGFTDSEACFVDPFRAVPFLAILKGLAFIGHTVWIFEGDASALNNGLWDADLVIVDEAMLPFLDGLAETAERIMRHPMVMVYRRATNGFEPLPPPAPAQEAPAQEAPAQEAPAQEAPAQEAAPAASAESDPPKAEQDLIESTSAPLPMVEPGEMELVVEPESIPMPADITHPPLPQTVQTPEMELVAEPESIPMPADITLPPSAEAFQKPEMELVAEPESIPMPGDEPPAPQQPTAQQPAQQQPAQQQETQETPQESATPPSTAPQEAPPQPPQESIPQEIAPPPAAEPLAPEPQYAQPPNAPTFAPDAAAPSAAAPSAAAPNAAAPNDVEQFLAEPTSQPAEPAAPSEPEPPLDEGFRFEVTIPT